MRSLLFCCVFLLSACAFNSTKNCGLPYKLKVTQGQKITIDQINKLQLGMTSTQVQDLLGTQTLIDKLNTDRWIYHYSAACGGKIIEQESIVIYFDNGLLKKIEQFISGKSQPKILLPITQTEVPLGKNR